MRLFLRAIPFILAATILTVIPSTLHADESKSFGYLSYVENHLQTMLERGLDRYGPKQTPMWVSTLDAQTLKPRKDCIPARVYRRIGAPNGSTLYWDAPLLAAAIEISKLTGNKTYANAVREYVKAFMDNCIDKEGLFEWGNHKYYDVFEDKVIGFSGGYHEMRPHAPVWDWFWDVSPQKTERYIRVMTDKHVYDWESGGFNRHDNKKREHAFIEAGGVLTESLAWLYKKTGDASLLDKALRIAGYSYRHRGERTGLIVNNADTTRWDSKVTTTEIGLWAQSMLKAAEYSNNQAFLKMARDAVTAYLKYGYDADAQQYYGQLRITDGKPVAPKETGYWPQKYSNVYNTDQWPTHDYPMALAETALTLYKKTEEKVFLKGAQRWAQIVLNRSPKREGESVYAGNYGTCIHFLTRAGRALDDKTLLDGAHRLARESIDQLYENGLFQGKTGTHLYESVDGVGYLCLALIGLETDDDIDYLDFRY